MNSSSGWRNTMQVLKEREFTYFLGTRFFIIFSLFIQNTVLSYWLYTLTKNPLSLGLIGLAEVIPAFGFAFVAGYLVDQRIKRNVYRACIVFYLLNSLLMLVVTSSFMKETYTVPTLAGMVYAIMFTGGAIRAFIAPSSFSLLPLLVAKEKLPQAITWSSTAWMMGSVLGPLFGGIAMSSIGVQPTIACTFFLLLLSFFSIQKIRPHPLTQRSVHGMWEGLKQGFRFVFRTEVILAVLSLDLFAVLFGGAEALLPVFANDILQVGEVGYGWLRSAHGIGSLSLLIILANIPLKQHIGYKLLLCIFGYGLVMIFFGLSTNFFLSFACLFLAGLFDGVSVVIRHSILQLHTPEEMKGRVSSINMMFISSSNELGAFESGVAARYLGTIPAVVIGGVMTILVVLVTYWKAPSLRNLQLNPKPKE
jgi:MFS family permease